MSIGTRIPKIREEKKLSQGDLEKRTGLLRCYISRVENGHTVPSLPTLDKFASGLEVPPYLLVYDGDEPPVLPHLTKRQSIGSVSCSPRVIDPFLPAGESFD